MRSELFDLLEKRNRVSCSLIELFQLEDDWLEVKDISLNLDISDRSTQRYIHYLEEVIDEYNESEEKHIQMHYEKFKGIKFEFEDSSIEQLKLYIISNDESLKLLIDLCLLRTEVIKKYSEKNFISVYSIKNSLKKIAPLLNSFKIAVDPGKLTFVGEEKYIRIFIYSILWSLYKNDSWPFQYIDEQRLYTSIDSIEKSMELTFTDIHKKQMTYFMAICLIRNRKKMYIEDFKEWEEYVNVESLRHNEEIIIKGMNNYQIFSSSEIIFILVVMETKHRMYKSNDIKERVLKYHKKRNSDVYQLTTLMVEKFQKDFFPIPEDSIDIFFTYCFCSHLQCRIFPGINFDLEGYDIFGHSDTSRHLIEKLHQFIGEMKDDSNRVMLEQEEFLIKKYLPLFSYYESSTIYEPQIELVIDSDLPFLVRAGVKKRLLGQFEECFNLKMTETVPENQDNYLVITNMPSLNEEAKNVCVVDSPLRHGDFQLIEKKLAEKLEQLYLQK